MTISFPIPPIDGQYRTKPYRYVSHVLGHEGAGSLLSLLKAQGWADQLMAGESRSHSDFANFDVTVELTDEGNPYVEEIVALVFACIAMIRSSSSQPPCVPPAGLCECQQPCASPAALFTACNLNN